MRQYERLIQKCESLAEIAKKNGHPELAETAESISRTLVEIDDV